MSIRVGSLIFATDQGLGILAKAFVDHGIVTDPMVLRHGKHPDHFEWYPNAPVIGSLSGEKQRILDFCASMDVMLFFETPFLHDLLPFCRERGVKTVVCPMHECLHRAQLEPQNLPDLWLCPSQLDLRVVGCSGAPGVFIPVPVDTKLVPWRQRTKAEVFVHNAGHGGLKGRNGTRELMAAIRHVKSEARFIIRSQEPLSIPLAFNHSITADKSAADGRFDYRIEKSLTMKELWSEGDVFVFPERFNGLSLPIQEARAAGMLVMCGDRFPMNTWLPTKVETTTAENEHYRTFSSPLVPVARYEKNRVSPNHTEFDDAIFDPRAIAAKIDEWFGKDVSEYSKGGKVWAEEMSWDALGPKYIEVLENLCRI